MDEEVIKDFESKLAIFNESFNSIAADFSSKLSDLSNQTKNISENVQFLKRMKIIYDEQNRTLELMESTILELMSRLDRIEGSGYATSKKKRKKK